MRKALARRLARAGPGVVLSLALFALSVPAYFLTVIHLNMPEQWLTFFGLALLLGFAVGRGWSVAAAAVVLAGVFVDGPGEESAEGTGYAVVIYFPFAVLSIAAGVLVHRGLARLIALRAQRECSGKTVWDCLLGGGHPNGSAQ